MIINAKIIEQPYSGEYDEFIYDVADITWKSECWSWIKFTNDDYIEWCGMFRGKMLGIEMSNKFNSILILTTDCLYEIDKITGNMISNQIEPEYESLTVSPLGEYILSKYNEIVFVKENLNIAIKLNTPKDVYSIDFLEWKDYMLKLILKDSNKNNIYSNAVLDSNEYKIILEK